MAAGDYVKLDEVKDFLSITDNKDDTELNNLKLDADQDIELQLRPFADQFPLTKEFLNAARRAGMFYVVSCYKDKLNNEKAAERFMKKFESKMKSLKDALKSVPTTRTKIVSASQSYDTEDDVLFSQRIFR